MKQFISFIVIWLIALNIFVFFMGAAIGSLHKDCHIGKSKRWEYVLPGIRLGCESSKYIREFDDWMSEEVQ
jgi:hypothetical protein